MMSRVLGQLESDDGDRRRRMARIDESRPRLDLRQLVHRGAAVMSKLRFHALRGDAEHRSTTKDEVGDRIAPPYLEVLAHHERGRIAKRLFAVGPANEKAHLRHV